MYKVRFTIGDNDVIRCRVGQGNDHAYIELSQKSIYNILNALIKQYKPIDEIDENYSYVTFKNVNEQELEYYYEQEEKREKEIRRKIQEEKRKQTQIKNKKQRKVKRKNKFKRTVIALTLATTATLIAVANQKEANTLESPAFEDTYNPPIVDTNGVNEITKINMDLEYDSPKEKNNINEDSELLELDIEENTQNEKYLYCKNNYGDLITKYANMYGIDPKVAIAVFTHERGYHSDTMDPGGAIGLCQVQLDVWNDKDIKAFNFETNSWETYHIKEENIKNLEQNIKAGVMILQESLRQVSYMILQGVQNYNYGLGNLNVAFRQSGLNANELNEQNNKEWMQYRDLIKGGDPLYIEHVFQYIPSDSDLHFKTPDGKDINLHYVAQKNLTM